MLSPELFSGDNIKIGPYSKVTNDTPSGKFHV